MKYLIALLALATSMQNPGPSRGSKATAPPSCNPPTMQYRWTPTSGCSTSTVCMTDAVVANNASQTNSANLPTYSATGGPNSQPELVFGAGSANDYLVFGTPVPLTLSTFTIYAVVNITTASLSNAIFGGAVGGIEYRINSSNNPELLKAATLSIGSGTQTLSAGTWYTQVMTYTSASGYNFYHANGGSLTLAGTGSSSTTFLGAANNIGAGAAQSEVLTGNLAEVGFLNSVNTAGIAAWSSCHFGI